MAEESSVRLDSAVLFTAPLWMNTLFLTMVNGSGSDRSICPLQGQPKYLANNTLSSP